MTPQDKCDLLKTNTGSLFTRLQKEAHQLLFQRGNFEGRIKRMFGIIDQLAGEVAKIATCGKGCSHCCYQAVLINEWEAKRIAKYAKRKMADIAGYHPNHDSAEQLQERFSNVPCPFLSDGACGVYPVRPSGCRLHFSFADDAGLCDIQNLLGGEVPYYDFELLKNMTAGLLFQNSSKFGDIREFFGERE